MKLIPLLAVAGAAAYFYNRSRKSRIAGSPTNETLDAGVKETFPASDPISVERDETAYEKQKRLGG